MAEGGSHSGKAAWLNTLRDRLHQPLAHMLTCSDCGQWTAKGRCLHCGSSGGGEPPEHDLSFPGIMMPRFNPHEQIMLFLSILKWVSLGSVVGLLSGSASALFLASLEWATGQRLQTPALLWGLPAAGAAVGWLYSRFGKGSEKGNNLILDQIHRPNQQVPLRMAPLVLLGTVATQLFGGSAGREGTAVQMGSSLADAVAHRLRLSGTDRRLLLMSGISGGFGSVFGTPLAGTVFGMEVLRVGAIRYEAMVACLTAAMVGDRVTLAWGIKHSHYAVTSVPEFSLPVALKILVSGVLFGLAALLFAELTHALKTLFKTLVPSPSLRPAAGGLLVILLALSVGTRQYLGLGLPLIEGSFSPEPVPAMAFFWKTVFTALTLGTGFQGGEVTPLFVVGATLGNVLGYLWSLPPDLMAAVGFVAVFAGAANTPLACLLLGAELFGAAPLPYIGIGTIISYVFSGHRGIYLAQRVETAKSKSVPVPNGVSLHVIREVTPPLLRGGSQPDTTD